MHILCKSNAMQKLLFFLWHFAKDWSKTELQAGMWRDAGAVRPGDGVAALKSFRGWEGGRGRTLPEPSTEKAAAATSSSLEPFGKGRPVL